MVYLPAGMNRTRSRNASNLYADQAAMGVTPPSGGGGVPTSPSGGFTPQSQAQPSRMTEYLQQQQQQRDMLGARGEDLRLANMMFRALDPAMPKGFRQLGLKQVSQMLGVDPRGDRAKELINTLSGLDPQSLEGLRRGIAQSTDEAEPGQISQMTRGVLTGQVPPDQLMQMAAGALQPPAPAQPTEVEAPQVGGGGGADFEPPMRLGAGTGLGGLGGEAPTDVIQAQAPGQAPLPGAPLPPRRQQPATMPENAAPTTDIPRSDESHVPYRMRELEPEYNAILGLNPDRYRLTDIHRAGWNRIPSDPTARQKVFDGINASQQGLVDTMSMASQLASLIRGRPEAMDASVWIPTVGTLSINPSSLGSKVYSFTEGLANIVGFNTDQTTVQILQDIAADPRTAQFSQGIANKIAAWAAAAGQRINDTAELNSRINSIMVPLAFAMAAAKGQTGRFLSDRDVQFQLQEIGQSNNPDQMIAALTDMVGRLNQQYDTKMRVTTGAAVPLTGALSPETVNIIAQGGIAPRAIMELIGAPTQAQAQPGGTGTALSGNRYVRTVPQPGEELAPRRMPGLSGTIDMALNPPPAGFRARHGADIQGPQPGTIPRNPPASQAPTPDPAAIRGPAAVPGRRAIERAGPTLEQEETAAIGRIQEDRAAAMEQRNQNRRRLEIQESQEARAQRAEVEQRRARIQHAFAQIGQMLRGAISVGGGGISAGGGSEQDPSAFRIAAPPQRRAPTPVQAAPYQPQVPQRRR